MFVSIIICILPPECLTINLIDNNLNELNSIDFIIPRPGRARTISCVRFVMVVMVVKVGSQLDKNIPYDYLYQGPPFYTGDTRNYQQQARK